MVSVLTDIGADVIKIGMLGNSEIINAVADVIDEHAPETTIVLDPVMVATSGDILLEEIAVKVLIERLIPHADVITPNAPEAARLTGLAVDDVDTMRAAGQALLMMGAFSAVMKGGHIDGPALVDLLITEQGMSMMSGPRIRTRHTHGTGCTLASAIAAGLARGLDLETAVQSARDFVYQAIASAPKLGSTDKNARGPLNHGLVSMEAEGEDTPTEPASDNPFAALKGLN
ncbi:MAG: bifunctional hydroxymethylpyrimidine kinase/phosphomethylpyrimidine kinase, partial [Robiginitomaculum sp.]